MDPLFAIDTILLCPGFQRRQVLTTAGFNTNLMLLIILQYSFFSPKIGSEAPYINIFFPANINMTTGLAYKTESIYITGSDVNEMDAPVFVSYRNLHYN